MSEKPIEIKVETRIRTKKNVTTGKWAEKERTRVILNPQDLSIDELPPAGVKGQLLKENPQKEIPGFEDVPSKGDLP